MAIYMGPIPIKGIRSRFYASGVKSVNIFRKFYDRCFNFLYKCNTKDFVLNINEIFSVESAYQWNKVLGKVRAREYNKYSQFSDSKNGIKSIKDTQKKHDTTEIREVLIRCDKSQHSQHHRVESGVGVRKTREKQKLTVQRQWPRE